MKIYLKSKLAPCTVFKTFAFKTAANQYEKIFLNIMTIQLTHK